MFVVDDILLFPVKSILWIFRELHNAAWQEKANEAENLTQQLSDLYMMLETEKITEEEFDRREQEILDRLDALEEEEEEDYGKEDEADLVDDEDETDSGPESDFEKPSGEPGSDK